jgi:hypothetical protein
MAFLGSGHTGTIIGVDLLSHYGLLPQKGLVNLMYIFNAILRLEYWPKSLRIAQIIMIPKPEKNPMDVSSYRLISLLPTISKVLKKTYTQNIKDLKPQDWIPNQQPGFRQADSRVKQCHRVTVINNKATENQQYLQLHF